MLSKLIIFIICAAICLTTLAYGTVHQSIIAVFYLSATIIAILWATDCFASGEIRFNTSFVQIPLIAAILYGVIQIIPFGSLSETGGVSGIPRTISLDSFSTQLIIVHLAALLIYFAVSLAYIDTAKRIRTIVFTITIFGFCYAFFAILQSFLSPNKIYGVLEVPFATPFGSFVNRHNFAAFMEMTIAVPLGLLVVGGIPQDKRLIYLTAIVLMGVALILSGSRGGLVSLLAMIFFVIFITTQAKNYGSFILKIGLAVVLITTIIVGASLIGGESSLTRLAETAESKDITTNRSHIWNVTLEVIKNSPVLGAGIGAFGVAYTPHDTLNGLERVEQAHNDYLQVAADAGVIGLLIGGAFLFILFKTGLKNIKTSNLYRKGVAVGALGGCFAVLIHSLFDFVLHTTAISLLFLTLVSLVVVSGKGQPDELEVETKRKKRKANVTPIDARRIAKVKSEK
jgi:O-antigen ligase